MYSLHIDGNRLSGPILFIYSYFIVFKERYISYDSLLHIISCGILGIFVIGKWGCFFSGDGCYNLRFSGTHQEISKLLLMQNYNPIYDSIFGLFILNFKKFTFLFQIDLNSFWLCVCISFLVALYQFIVEFFRLNPAVWHNFSINQIIYFCLIFVILIHASYKLLLGIQNKSSV